MSDVDLARLVAALRDTASKATEKVVSEEPFLDDYGRLGGIRPGGPRTREVCSDKYDRHWIAGRIEGMADMLEAMLAPPPTKNS